MYLVPVPNYWTWAKTTPQKKWFFWSNSYKIEVMITSVRQIRVTKLWSYDHIYNIIWIMWQNFVGDFIDRIYDVITFISKYIYFKKDWGSHFCWHHQNLTMLFTAIYKDSKKDKIDRNYVAKYNLYLYFLI